MNANAKQWVVALRSGEYLPGLHHLRSDCDEYCPLGVLCQLHYEATGKLKPVLHKMESYYSFGSNSGSLPPEVRDWAGLISSWGDFHAGSIIILYVGDKKTFPEIADVIESEPPGLFVGTH